MSPDSHQRHLSSDPGRFNAEDVSRDPVKAKARPDRVGTYTPRERNLPRTRHSSLEPRPQHRVMGSVISAIGSSTDLFYPKIRHSPTVTAVRGENVE
ncbi:hypothetical protein GWI33_006872 [Rhynchophorus ferrugineus]|uniref:Uncharacterized protein n=1 Tax=Rhynchophorus ferrugineus TaxID=354439 RepID=A0A834III8_RHYFE|nr:hypothetical protein GWI33_006872 [Rhynchophorus ferrugineus]